jgi:hypothetical protein
MHKTRAMTVLYIFLVLVRRTFKCQDPLQLIRAPFVPVSQRWTRINVDGPGPVSRHHHTMTLIGSKLFVFGGKSTKYLNDIWALDLDCCTFAARFPEPFDQIFQQ